MLNSWEVLLSPLESLGTFFTHNSISCILFSYHLAGLQQPALPADQDPELSSGEPETV